ncbi:hypothetical protein RHMOL_Rhmol10G0021300 [Rhododendron molle]|uniref:Uncharacterized protein n=1 Tax=Rhododendron molle TaxID=49168 RepID=A0ACC0LZ02_RHOML|nr:hypothetical protein RHMOL_Rhmol10G0021300 [Rhododendron molle]
MEVLRVVVTLSLLVSSVLRVGSEEVMATEIIPAIFNFGDSNSDTGGISAAFFPKTDPFGETFFHRPAGRASDGRLIIDFIAERLKLPYLSAYLDSVGTNFQQGANFATAGATIRRQEESWFKNGISPFPLDIQVEQYVQFKARTNYLYNKADTETSQRSNLPIPEDFSKALYTIDIGQNDLVEGFRNTNDEQFRAEIPDIMNKFSAAVQQLYQEGARAFWIHNTGPIGCLPLATVNIQNPKPGYLDEHGCIKGWNAAAVEFNKQLKDAVTQLRAELPQAALTYVDIYAAKYGLINDAKNQGFLDPFNICCGHYGNGISVGCGIKANVNGAEVFGGSCEDPSTVISWDGVHYTEAANFWVANQILNGSFSDPPNPITQLDEGRSFYMPKHRRVSKARVRLLRFHLRRFTDPLKICCGHHENYDHVWCGQKASINGTQYYGASCASPSTFFSWDGVHYSDAANHWIADRILNGSLSEPPILITHACHKNPSL